MLIKKLVAARGAAARPQITTIGLGGQLDSELLMVTLASALTLTPTPTPTLTPTLTLTLTLPQPQPQP